jgi:MFS family permease
LAGFEKHLGLTGYDYNTILSVFYISYIIFEIPSNIVCKWWGPGWFIPTISLGFGICSIATAFVKNLAQVCAVRFLLGVFEAGVLPGIAYYLVSIPQSISARQEIRRKILTTLSRADSIHGQNLASV